MGFVAVVDYGMGNIDSVRRALEVAGATVVVTGDPDDLADADRIVLPGVGAFGVAMANLRRSGLDVALTEQVVGQGAPFLGICLGMQLMATSGSEHGDHEGLGWVDAMRCADDYDRLATTPYGGGFTSAVARGSAVGVQFHPEKSQGVGQALIRAFLAWDG